MDGKANFNNRINVKTMIHIKRLQEDGAEIIALIGEIDASSSIELDLAIAKSVGEGFSRILVDCHSLEYISSAGTSTISISDTGSIASMRCKPLSGIRSSDRG